MTSVTCGYCGYVWDTTSHAKLVTCPMCRHNCKNSAWKEPKEAKP
jgi:hypothetical protein